MQLPPDTPLTDPEKRHIAGLMRVNHAGEIAAQGLYRGHALFVPQRRARANSCSAPRARKAIIWPGASSDSLSSARIQAD